MAIKRVGTGNRPPPVPPIFPSRKHAGCGPELKAPETLKKYRDSKGYPSSGGQKH